MTTVVIDCRTLEVATDSQTTCTMSYNDVECEHTLHYDTSKKIFEPTEGVVFVGAGDKFELSRHYQSLLNNGHLSNKISGTVRIAILRKKDKCLHVDLYESVKKKNWWGKPYWEFEQESFVSNTEVITMGTGGKFAYAGMMTGMNVKEAVLLACQCDPFTDDNVQYYKFK